MYVSFNDRVPISKKGHRFLTPFPSILSLPPFPTLLFAIPFTSFDHRYFLSDTKRVREPGGGGEEERNTSS